MRRIGSWPAVVVLAVVIASPDERFPEYVPWLVEATAARSVTGSVTHVRDGDTIEVRGVPIRFGSLDCAELDAPEGRAAKVAMQVLVNRRMMTCHLTGKKSDDRMIGSRWLENGQDVAAAMMIAGYCRRYW